MSAYNLVRQQLKSEPRHWAITGVAGFIGSNLLQTLLELDQNVVGLDNLSSGKTENLDEVKALVTPEQWKRFKFKKGDIRELADCDRLLKNCDYLLHHAALGSVPESIANPKAAYEHNVLGFLNILLAARDHKVSRVIFASSSAVYGNNPEIPKTENMNPDPLSPYAATKLADEHLAHAFQAVYGITYIGFRYFNIYGARQDPAGHYAAVIPKWASALLKKEIVYINGTGETTRDFCHVQNIIQLNLLAATTTNSKALNQIYNGGLGKSVDLLELLEALKKCFLPSNKLAESRKPVHRDFLKGEVLHSQASIQKSKDLLGYVPELGFLEGLKSTTAWYAQQNGVKG